MKSTLVMLIVAVALIVPSWSMSCLSEPERCKDTQCCTEFGLFGYCRAYLTEGEKCELNPIKSRKYDHVYVMKCPCGEGLTCEEDDSGSILQGRCVRV